MTPEEAKAYKTAHKNADAIIKRMKEDKRHQNPGAPPIKNPRNAGRKPEFGVRMPTLCIHITQPQLDWLNSQPRSKSQVIREILDEKLDSCENSGKINQ